MIYNIKQYFIEVAILFQGVFFFWLKISSYSSFHYVREHRINIFEHFENKLEKNILKNEEKKLFFVNFKHFFIIYYQYIYKKKYMNIQQMKYIKQF